MSRESDLTVVLYNDISTKKNKKKNTFVAVAFWIVTSCSVVKLLPKFTRNMLLPVTAHGVNPETPTTSDFTAARSRSTSHAFLLFAYFIDY